MFHSQDPHNYKDTFRSTSLLLHIRYGHVNLLLAGKGRIRVLCPYSREVVISPRSEEVGRLLVGETTPVFLIPN